MKPYQTELRVYPLSWPWRAKQQLIEIGFPEEQITQFMPMVWLAFFVHVASCLFLGVVVLIILKDKLTNFRNRF
ncbi:MAG: hypothetical protein H7Z42_20685 [Roseiflexaceae bacterium]|nr:hypothetical protein [Roseiflexaceae bacterium]